MRGQRGLVVASRARRGWSPAVQAPPEPFATGQDGQDSGGSGGIPTSNAIGWEAISVRKAALLRTATPS